MAFVHGKSGFVLINDAAVSADIKSWTVTHERETSDATGVGSSGFVGVPGLMEGKMEVEGLFNSAADRLQEVINTTVGVDNDLLVSVWPEGATIGAPALFAACDTESYEVESSVQDAVTLNFEGAAHGMVDMGVVLYNHGTISGSGNHTSVDNLAATTNGAAAMLHVTSVSTGDTLAAKVQHSTDNSVWADLITFTTTPSGTKLYEYKEVAFGTTVNRYTRAVSTTTGSAISITFGLSFARR